MKASKVVSLILGLIMFAGVMTMQTQGQTFNKQTKVSFSQPVAVPGRVLPAGTYTFTILDSPSSRNIVQIWNRDKTNLITTILAIPNYRLKPTGETVIKFSERPADQPQAVKAWFYPGYAYGIEFVYPKGEALQIAQAANEAVPAEAVEPTPSTLKTLLVIGITPAQKEEPIAQAIQTTPVPAEPAVVAQELPRTGSLTPLIALVGLVCLMFGFCLRRFSTKPL
jgi:hypothetical protein